MEISNAYKLRYPDGYNQQGHKAFTGLTKFNGKYYLVFRHGENHVSENKQTVKQVIFESMDGDEWQLNSTYTEPERDDGYYDYRDSFFTEKDGMLYLFGMVSRVSGCKRKSFSQVRVLNANGRFSTPKDLNINCIWHPIVVDNTMYATCYRYINGLFEVELQTSEDGYQWHKVMDIGYGSESCLFPVGENKLCCFMRTEEPPYHTKTLLLNLEDKSVQELKNLERILQAPEAFNVNGRQYLIARDRPDYLKTADLDNPSFSEHRVKIFEVQSDYTLSEVFVLPSSGDCGYTGVAYEDNNKILISYYSQHDNTNPNIFCEDTEIYFAQISSSII